MTKRELLTILRYSDVNDNQDVRVKIKDKFGHFTYAQIESFATFTDAVRLDVTIENNDTFIK